MGARSQNFYNDLAKRLGYEAAAAEIQNHFLAGRREEAAAAVPDALIDEISLVGPPERIRDRLQAWQEIAEDNWVGSLVLAGADVSGNARHRRGGDLRTCGWPIRWRRSPVRSTATASPLSKRPKCGCCWATTELRELGLVCCELE